MMKFLLKYFVELTGNAYSSTLLKSFSQSRLSKPLIRPFSKAYSINLKETEYPIHHYQTLHDFFTRRLKDKARLIDYSSDTFISPVDALLSEMGTIAENQTFYIKDQLYTLEKILGSKEKANVYRNGHFYILYLSPSHYHRFHYPITGRLESRYALGEKSYPVNQFGLKYGNMPFSTNYRIISELASPFGKIAMIKIGALNINSIQLHHTGSHFNKGEELGYFSFGSTILLLFEENSQFQPLMKPNTEVLIGQAIAKWMNK